MNTVTNAIQTVEKELHGEIKFPKQEVLKNTEQIKNRKYEAERAMMAGNTYNNKVKVVFEDWEGKKMVEVIVWGVTDKYLLLKEGMSIPLHRIHEII